MVPVQALLGRIPGGDYPLSTAAALLLSIQATEVSDPKGLTRRLLQVLAALSPDGVRRDLLDGLRVPRWRRWRGGGGWMPRSSAAWPGPQRGDIRRPPPAAIPGIHPAGRVQLPGQQVLATPLVIQPVRQLDHHLPVAAVTAPEQPQRQAEVPAPAGPAAAGAAPPGYPSPPRSHRPAPAGTSSSARLLRLCESHRGDRRRGSPVIFMVGCRTHVPSHWLITAVSR